MRKTNKELFDDPNIDWLELIRGEFDPDFYVSQLYESWEDPINWSAHYLFSGWRTGLLPRAGYRRERSGGFADEIEKNVPALVLDLATRRLPALEAPARSGIRAIRSAPAPKPAMQNLGASVRRQFIQIAYENAIARGAPVELTILRADRREYADYDLNLVAQSFDYEFYASEYPDVAKAGIDGMLHYWATGWQEKRNPAPWFSTEYYLTAYPDIASAGVNPFWHYLIAGKAEGRLPRGLKSPKRAILDSLKPLEARTEHYPTPEHVRISGQKLRNLLKRAAAHTEGIVVSASHDCYPTATGGVQLFVADEQLRFKARGFAYVHLSPLRAAVYVRDDPAESTATRIVVDGKIVGVASDAEIAEALQHLSHALPSQRAFIVHSPLGHSVLGLARIHSALQAQQSFFWLHDYTSLCSGFQLLRNDIEYCGAPGPHSESCRVCIHGATRQTGERRLRALFEQCDFTIVSPSEFTRALWLEATTLPHKGAVVVEHSHFEEIDERLDLGAPHQVGTGARPVRVAFVGYPVLHKGWMTFERILDSAAEFANYSFFHFGSAGSLRARRNLRGVDSKVSADDRDLMITRLRENDIDIVVMPAEWPETFSYVAFEALAAGCDIVTLGRSGNIAAVVRKLHRGLVFEHEDEIVEFFATGKAIAYARARAEYGAYASELIHDGTTAALI